jgi:hypothetical protein
VRRRDTEQEAGNRQHAVVRTENTCTQPSGSASAMNMWGHDLSKSLCSARTKIKSLGFSTTFASIIHFRHIANLEHSCILTTARSHPCRMAPTASIQRRGTSSAKVTSREEFPLKFATIAKLLTKLPGNNMLMMPPDARCGIAI